MEFHGSDRVDDNADGWSAGDTRPHLVVIGNGMAGCRAVEELLARDAGRFRITIFGAEPHVNYNRILLSPVLAAREDVRRNRDQRRRLVCR